MRKWLIESNKEKIKSWFNMLLSTGAGQYYIIEKCNVIGINAEEEVAKMTKRQQAAVLKLLVAAHNHGCDTTRKHFIQMREDQKRWNKG